MQVFVLLAIVAAATAAPTFVVNSAPIAHLPATPSTFYSSSFAYGAIPTTYSAGVPTTYLAGRHFPSVYSAGAAFSPLTYSSGNVVSAAVIPKYFAENEGARHIVNY